MSLGNKIYELRKQNGLNQEQLAEKLDITRQTISNWETNQTAPDIEQAKQLSVLFNVSLDELVDNNITNMVVEKISNTERLAGIIIKILKWFGIFLVAYLILIIITILLFTVVKGTGTQIVSAVFALIN